MPDLPEALKGVEAKLRRAKAHLDALDKEVSAVMEGRYGDPIACVKEIQRHPDGKTGLVVVKIGHVKTPPLDLGAKIGDVVHNLRSALDHMAWQLGRLNQRGSDPADRTAFPLNRTRQNFESKRTTEILKDLHPDHRAVIEKCQPYRGGDYARLGLLRDLSNTDKHREVNTALVASDDLAFTFKPLRDCRLGRQGLEFEMIAGYPVEIGTEVARVPIDITGDEPDVDVETEGSLHIAFSNGEEVMSTLHNIGYSVDTVLGRLRPFFDTEVGRTLGPGTKDAGQHWPDRKQRLTFRVLDSKGQVVAETTGKTPDPNG
jgi:hypothetical protein